MFTGAHCIGMFGSRWDVAPHISAPPTAPHRTAQHHTYLRHQDPPTNTASLHFVLMILITINMVVTAMMARLCCFISIL